MNIITALVHAAVYFLRIKATRAAYDLSKDIESDIEKQEEQIESLRDLGDPASQLAADRIRARVLRARAVYARLELPEPQLEPAARIEAGGRNSAPVEGRDIHSAG